MRATAKGGTNRADDYEPVKGEFLSLIEFANYQLSVLAVESLGLTKHAQEFQDWLVSASVSLPLKTDLLNAIYKDHPQKRAFRKVLSSLQSLWQFGTVLATPSQASYRSSKASGGDSLQGRVPFDELKSRLAELREVEDVLVYWLACVKRGAPPSISADDFVDSVS